MLIENILLCVGIFILIFLLIILIIAKEVLKEFFKQENYIKSMQFIFVITLLTIFIATFVYFWINNVEVNKMYVVFTIVVGWLGLIIGAFFWTKIYG